MRVVIGLLLVGFAVRCAAADMTNDVICNGDRLVRDLGAASEPDRVAEGFRAQRAEVIVKLMSLVREPNGRDDQASLATRIGAIKVLGAMRAEEAVPLLIEHIDTGPFLVDEKHFGTMFPSAIALIEIGKSSSKAALRRLGKVADPKRDRLLCDVILRVEGVAVGRFMIEDAIKKSNDPQERARLSTVLPFFVE